MNRTHLLTIALKHGKREKGSYWLNRGSLQGPFADSR